MEMVLKNGFCEMAWDEMLLIDGGGSLLDWAAVVGGVYSVGVSACTVAGMYGVATCAAIAASPVVAVTGLVAGIVSLSYAIYCAVS